MHTRLHTSISHDRKQWQQQQTTVYRESFGGLDKRRCRFVAASEQETSLVGTQRFVKFTVSSAHDSKAIIVSNLLICFSTFVEEDGIPLPEVTQADLITLTSHPDAFGVDPIPISWGHPDPAVRGPVICTVRHSAQRNAIGAHQGSYCVYTGLAVAAGKLDPSYVPNLSLTSPVFQIGPYPSWSDPKKISALDPFGHLTTDAYGDWLEKGWDIRPTIVSASEQTLVFRSRRGKTC